MAAKGKIVRWFAAVAGAVLIAFLIAVVTQRVTDKSPEVVVRQYYNTVEQEAAVPDRIGGVNLVVLSAATLQHLVDRKVLTKEEAQRMLNEAKVVER